MKSVISIAAGVLVLGFLFYWGSLNRAGTQASVQGVPSAHAATALTASETFHDFGTISMKDGNVSKDFAVANPTNADITVSSVVTSCMCTTAYLVENDGSLKGPFGMTGMGAVPLANEVIKAGESRAVRVVYDPNAHGPAGVGAIDRFVMLTDSDGGSLELEIKAVVTP